MSRKNILLADDAELRQALENSFFHRAGFTLLVAESGEQAFEMLEEEDPGLAVLTLEMPGRSGDSVCRQAKEDAILRSTPIILVLNDDQVEEEARCREAGSDAILLRPIDNLQLQAVACRALNISHRADPRIEADFPVLFGRDGEKPRPGRVRNINAGGVFVETDWLVPVDTVLVLELDMPGQTFAIRCRTRVAWVNHPEWIKAPVLPVGMGIQFLDHDAEAEAAIDQFIHTFRPS